MSQPTIEDRIRALAGGLTPVRPIPPLPALAAVAVALWLAAVGVAWLAGGLSLRQSSDPAWSNASYLAALAGLALLAGGAMSAAVAIAVPGREAAVRAASGLAAAGVTVAIAGGIWGLAREGVHLADESVFAGLHCAVRGALLGAASTLFACAFLVHTGFKRPRIGAALAIAAGTALGALAVHLTCPSDSSLHQLAAHSLSPLVAAAVLAAPLAGLLRRWLR